MFFQSRFMYNLPDVPTYDELNLETQINMYSCTGSKALMIHSIEEMNGTFSVSLNLKLESRVVGTWHATHQSQVEAIKYVCTQCLVYLCQDRKYSTHFTLNITDPNFLFSTLYVNYLKILCFKLSECF